MERTLRHSFMFALLLMLSMACASAQARELPDFTELVAQAAPGVVNISTTRTVSSGGFSYNGPGGEDIPEIFRRFLPPSARLALGN